MHPEAEMTDKAERYSNYCVEREVLRPHESPDADVLLAGV